MELKCMGGKLCDRILLLLLLFACDEVFFLSRWIFREPKKNTHFFYIENPNWHSLSKLLKGHVVFSPQNLIKFIRIHKKYWIGSIDVCVCVFFFLSISISIYWIVVATFAWSRRFKIRFWKCAKSFEPKQNTKSYLNGINVLISLV